MFESDPQSDQFLADTTDFGLAVALISAGFPLLKMQMFGKRARFYFVNSRKLEKAITDYWNKSLKVSARAYHENSRMLKTRIYSEGVSR